MTWHTLWALIVGLAIGSFANVVIHRLPRMITRDLASTYDDGRYDLWWPSSHCPHCQARVKMWNNIPLVSYVWLKGRCASCHTHISWQYPFVEAFTALLWGVCAWHWGLNITAACWAGFFTVLFTASVIDWQTQLLPDDLTQALVWGGLIASSLGWLDLPLPQAVWGAALGYASLWLIAHGFEAVTGKQGMGAGDFKLFAGLGAWLGPLALMPLLLWASLGGALVGLFLKFTHQLSPEGHIPFGPFLALAASLVVLLGPENIMVWMQSGFLA